VTAVFVAPVTAALSCTWPLVVVEVLLGEMLTLTRAVTVAVALALLVGSAPLTALTV
jgi:hypothetical protein